MIIITGASKGLGAAIAGRLQSNGKQVIGLARDTRDLGYDGFDCDVGSYGAVKAAAKTVKTLKTPVEAVINAAGIASMNMAVTTSEEVVEKVIRTNLMGTIHVCQLFAPLMMRHKQGVFINFSTIAVALALKGESIYAASKAGVESFSRTFAREMADFNIRVNCIAPGPVKTNLLKGITDAQINKIIDQQIIQTRFEKSDICDAVDLLLDPKSASLSGQVLNIGGV